MVKKQGGLEKMGKRNQAKAALLYRTIDDNDFYQNTIATSNRSRVNVPFKLKNNKLEAMFLQQSQAAGLYALKGHRLVGGMRASLYNAMPLEGVQTLVDFMLEFIRHYG